MNALLDSQPVVRRRGAFKGLLFALELAARGHDIGALTGFPKHPDGKLYPGYRIRPMAVGTG